MKVPSIIGRRVDMSKKSKRNKENRNKVPNTQNPQAIRKTRNIIFLPINMFRIFVVVAVIILSSLVLFGNYTELRSFQLNLANQILLSLLLLVNGITGLKSSDKQKRGMAYTSLLLALFLLGFTVITLLNS